MGQDLVPRHRLPVSPTGVVGVVWLLLGLGAWTFGAMTATARPAGKIAVAPGYDLFATVAPTTDALSIPAGFFGADSQAVMVSAPLQGVPIGYFHGLAVGDTDTIVQRLSGAGFPSPTSSATVPVQLVQLSLMGTGPIKIDFTNGPTELWNLTIQLEPGTQPHGTEMLHGQNADGGSSSATIPFDALAIFRLEGTNQTKTLDLGQQTLHWNTRYTYDASGRLVQVLDGGFCAACQDTSAYDFIGRSLSLTQHLHVATTLTTVPPGDDGFETMPSGTAFDFKGPATIPPDFFGSGSDAFTGQVPFHGNPIGTFDGADYGTADTVVGRLSAANFVNSNQANVPLQILALSLESVKPIAVKYKDGHTEQWSVIAGLSKLTKSTGTMTMIKVNDSGGTFNTDSLTVYPKLTFTRVSGGPPATRVIDTGSPTFRNLLGKDTQFKQDGAPWQRGCRGPALITNKSPSFCPGLSPDAKKVTSEEEAMLAAHGVRPAQPLELPSIACGPLVPPAPLNLPQGSSGVVQCPIKRTNFTPDSFFDVFVTIDVGSGGSGVTGVAMPASLIVQNGQQANLNIDVAAATNASVGTHTIPVELSVGAGDDRISRFFDVFVDVSAAGPAVTSTAPTSNATSVSPHSAVTINFNEQVTATGGAFKLECPSGTPVGFNASSSPATSYTLTPTSNLPAGTVCAVTVLASDISGAGGNMAADYSFSFTTDFPPQVSSTTPHNNETNVSTNSTITINFDKPVTPANGAFMLGCIVNSTLTPIQFTQSSTASGATWVLTPSSGLPANTACAVQVNANAISDAAGTPMAQNYQFTFQTGT